MMDFQPVYCRRAFRILSLVFLSFVLSACGLWGEPRKRSAKPKAVPVETPPAAASSNSDASTNTTEDSAWAGSAAAEQLAALKQAVEAPPTPEPAPVQLPWSYSGETGPENWGKVDPLYRQCNSGKNQSPIDLRWKKPVPGDLVFDYKESTLKITDTGYTIQVNFDPGSRATIHGKTYDLVHLQFRTSSEHTLSGNELPMELQLFHRNDQNEWAIVSIILIEGARNELIDQLWANIPELKSKEVSNPRFVFNPGELIPPRVTHYFYSGSLTTPPCTEGINWAVLNTPITASGEQILAFRRVYPSNKRPLQALNGRKVTNH